MKLTLEIVFKIGQLVYLKTDVQQHPRLVVGYIVRGNMDVLYELQAAAEQVTTHYDFEISAELNVIMNSTN